MYNDQDLLMLSGLQHYIFCPRQWALIHIEQLWTENLYTTYGNIMHEKVHSTLSEQRGNIRTVRSLKIVSYSLGLSGQTDVVEFHKNINNETGLMVPGVTGKWKAYPVEYKRGKPKKDKSDEVQLCAQAICLEEMLHTEIPEGAIFYGREKRRYPVKFDDQLREFTKRIAFKIHQMFNQQHTPPAVYEKKCKSCSLINLCMPERLSKNISVKNYMRRMIAGVYEENA
jgi:CRISPR-associated exonuclease Cas4